MQSDVVVVSHRPQVRDRLAALLRAIDSRPQAPNPRGPAPHDGASPSLAIVDILRVFPPTNGVRLSPFEVEAPRMMVVGSLGDGEQILAASGEGIPVHILEDLHPELVARMARPVGPPLDLYARLGRQCAEMVMELLSRERERAALTSRELQIARLLVDGRRNPQIADALGIEEKTVKNHINRLYGKLNVSNRYEAIAVLARLLSLPGSAHAVGA